MRVLGLCSYPVESAATRYRLTQFVEPLAQAGIELEISSFLSSEEFDLLYKNSSPLQKALSLWKPICQRVSETFRIRNYDLLLIQREAMIFGPAFFERLFQRVGNIPLILDLDDATYIRYVSPTYGKIGSLFKFFGKTDNLIKRAEMVVCGNRFIADYVAKKGTEAIVVPTVVDTDNFRPVQKDNKIPVIGWIGTHSTFPFLQSIFPVLQKLSLSYDYKLKIVGSGQKEVKIDGVETENLPWNLEREVADFQSFDIGLYPMNLGSKIPDEWIAGKSGFKAIQYMSVGIPFVMSPIGVCAEIGTEGETHFAARNLDDWQKHLAVLLDDHIIRRKMGESGREYALKTYRIDAQTEKLADAFQTVLNKNNPKSI